MMVEGAWKEVVMLYLMFVFQTYAGRDLKNP
jgi:hypothetical protein